MMRQVQFIAVIIFLLCVNLLAQIDFSSSKFNTTKLLKNGMVVYQNGPSGVNAGPYLYQESFEYPSFPPLDWELFSYGFDWELTNGNSYSGYYSAVINCGPYNEAWLITPEIDLSTGIDPSLRYYEFVELDQGLEAEHKVYISTDYDGLGDPSYYSWDELRSVIDNVFSWNLREIDLSYYIGETVYIAFYYYGVQDDFDCGTTWYIDDVEVDDFCLGGDPIPDCVTLTAPPNGAALNPTFGTVSWDSNDPIVTKQLLYLGTDGGGSVSPTNVYNGIELSPNVSGVWFSGSVTPNTTYYWQVIPVSSCETAVNCPIWSFTTNDGELNYGGGGTTQGGYYFANSTAGASGAPSQPAYSWIDISGTGTDLIGSISNEQTVGPFSLGFTFNFFGVDYTDFYINSNGFITFGATSGQTNFPFPIPSLNAPNNLIAGFWKDLDPTNTSVLNKHLYYGLSGGEMVISFVNYPQLNADIDGWITFQIIIKPSGNIKIQYQNAGNTFNINNGGIGIENNDGTNGVLYRHYNYGGNVSGLPLALEFGTNTGALPVELSAFSGAIIGQNVKLYWITKTETNNYGFEVERASLSASPLRGWEKIGFVNGNGNSNSPKEYSFNDKSILGGKYSYRLKQIDNDGQFEYSNNIEVDIEVPLEFALNQNYPNPFNPSTKISFQIAETAFTSLKVFDVLGNEVESLVNKELQAGSYVFDFDASSITSGIYFYKLQSGNLTSTKKMLMLK
ncbi:MAG: T9SS type A sorting domain-containing protein [Ignavibacteriaceae bacterium]|nr:T9SS type A sorting domain-containing protein [Ignavibacteriaceae bacterium]HRP91602.1 choice-of-anchor J domain-containing protein [Ignavibacteriaceae bacterium]